MPVNYIHKIIEESITTQESCKTCRKKDSDLPECPISHFGSKTRPIAEKTVEWCGCKKYEIHPPNKRHTKDISNVKKKNMILKPVRHIDGD